MRIFGGRGLLGSMIISCRLKPRCFPAIMGGSIHLTSKGAVLGTGVGRPKFLHYEIATGISKQGCRKVTAINISRAEVQPAAIGPRSFSTF